MPAPEIPLYHPHPNLSRVFCMAICTNLIPVFCALFHLVICVKSAIIINVRGTTPRSKAPKKIQKAEKRLDKLH
jgi:hypothetical protein